MNIIKVLSIHLLVLWLPQVLPAQADSLEIRFQPGETLYVYPNQGPSRAELYTGVVHNLAILNRDTAPVTLESARVDIEQGGVVTQTVFISEQQLDVAAKTFKAYETAGVLAAYDTHFQTSRYLEDVALAATRKVEPGSAVVVLRQVFLFQSLPDRLVVTATGRTSKGDTVSGSGALAIVRHSSPNEYWFPVRGRWTAAAAPSLHSHHRFASIQEFALDLIRFGAHGLSHEGDGTRLEQFFAYGEPVHAIANGEVVSVRKDMPESNDNLRQPGETSQDYFGRLMIQQQELLQKGFEFVLGNHVVLRHEKGEYSHYAHLQLGSVELEVGDRVGRGQKVGAVGHSGNSTEPHLHFHVTDGPSLSYSRALPVTFTNLTFWPDDDGSLEFINSGQIVVSELPSGERPER